MDKTEELLSQKAANQRKFMLNGVFVCFQKYKRENLPPRIKRKNVWALEDNESLE